MDPAGGSEPYSGSLPQPETPCLIVEDSQPDSAAPEDDPESSYRTVLARRLASLQPAACSPVLELIASPPGSRSSQADSQSEASSQHGADAAAGLTPSLKDRVVLDGSGCNAVDDEADSPAGDGAHSEGQHLYTGESCPLGPLALSQSQDLQAGLDEPAGPEASETGNSARSPRLGLSSGSPSRPAPRPKLSLQVLLHSQSVEPDGGLLSSQQDLFDANRSGTAVDVSGSDLDPHGDPTPTPAHSLRLLHLSGQGTLVHASLSQGSTDFVAATPDDFRHTPLIVPSSPTEPGHQNGGDDPTDVPDHGPSRTDQPVEAEPAPKPQPSASVLGSQHAPGSSSQRPLSAPSQPQFSHDVFVPTQSQQLSPQKGGSSGSHRLESAALASPLVLTENSESCRPQQTEPESPPQEDSQDTQILEPPGEDGPPDPAQPLPVESQALRGPSQPRGSSLESLSGGSDVPDSKRPSQVPEEPDADHTESQRLEVDDGATGVALVLSESQLLPSEPMEVDGDGDNCEESQSQGLLESHPRAEAMERQGAEQASQAASSGCDGRSVKDGSLNDSSGEISFHFTLPKEGELTGAAVGATPPQISQIQRALRHSTPIETPISPGRSGGPRDVCVEMVASASDPSPENDTEAAAATPAAGEKLSLRMKLVSPVEEGSSDRFSLQKPTLTEEEAPAAAVSTVSMAAPSSPSVFTRVRQVLRQPDADRTGSSLATGRPTPFRSPQRASQGCNSLPNSQSEPSQPGAASEAPPAGGVRTPSMRKPPPLQRSTESSSSSTPSKGETASSGPAHRRHVRTIQEVRTIVTRIITDVYYEDGREVRRSVTEESEEPVVERQVLDGSLTSGELADISSLSSKGSSSGGTSSTGPPRPFTTLPPLRGARSGRRGGGHAQRGRRGPRARSGVTPGEGFTSLVPFSPRGRARRGRPPSRSGLSRAPPVGLVDRLSPHGRLQSSSEEESYLMPSCAPVSPGNLGPSGHSSPEAAAPAGSSLVGLRVVAKWSSNGYFYSGRIIKDAEDGRFRLRFDDGYECEVAGKDVLLCDPIPVGTEVTALLEDEYFSVGVVKSHRLEGDDLFYGVERDGETQWYRRAAVLLSLDQGNRLREQHGLGPYEPSPPTPKASDISLDNLVEGKRKRRGTPGGAATPNRSSSSSPRTPGASAKRKLGDAEGNRTPSKRGRRGGGARAAQRLSLVNSSGSGTDLPVPGSDPADTHGPVPQNQSLFLGFVFMLTASSESDRLTNRAWSDDEEDVVQTGPYNKAYTKSQLQAGGGLVLSDFNEEQCRAAYQSLLISDQHCRSRKYLLSVSAGVPCVSHLWVRDCCREDKLLSYRNYLLPAGVDPRGEVVEWHPRRRPFSALHVLLLLTEPQPLWAQLLSLGGAASVTEHPPEGGRGAGAGGEGEDASDIPSGTVDVLVTDGPGPPEQLRAPAVSPEWLIHSVICGERQSLPGRPESPSPSLSPSS